MTQGQTEKASLYVVDKKEDHLDFLFNPTSYSVSKSAKWNRTTAKGAKQTVAPEYAGIDPASVQMEILFDSWKTSPGEDVSAHVAKLLDWLKATDESLHKNQPQPPILAFAWGRNQALAWFRGYLKSVSVKYLMFRHDGAPTRATASITLEEIPHDPPGQNPTSGGVAGRRTHVMIAGDSLHSVAHREYGDASMWRGLAELNGIDDPLRVAPGTTLLIADRDELLAGEEVA